MWYSKLTRDNKKFSLSLGMIRSVRQIWLQNIGYISCMSLDLSCADPPSHFPDRSRKVVKYFIQYRSDEGLMTGLGLKTIFLRSWS